MTTVRALKKLLLGETWIVPLGILTILLASALINQIASDVWAHLGSAALPAAVLMVLFSSVWHTARRR